MRQLQKNKLRSLIIICICIILLIIILKFTNNFRRSFCYDSNLRSAVFASHELLEDASISAPRGNDWLDRVQKELPNVPFDYWINFYKQAKSENLSCNEYPHLFKLNYHNTYWQTYERDNITFQLYSAYYDKRSGVSNGPVVRLLAMTNEREENIKFPESYCQLWYENSTKPTILPILEYHRIYPKYWGLLRGYLYPYLITCTSQPDADKRVPQTISLVKSHCETAKNNLRIWYEEPTPDMPKRTFAVCVKGLNFPYTDISSRLVEWFELLRILGVSKVFLYNLGVHPNITKILAYYQKIGFVDVQQLTLAGGEPSLPYYQYQLLSFDQMNKRLNEFIPYNDCLYRHMYKFDYIVALDIDEMIMPLEPNSNWHQLIESAMEIQRTKFPECKFGFAGVCFLNAYFPEANGNSEYQDIPKYMHMLRHIFRVPKHSNEGYATKCFHNTSSAHTLHNHFALTWLNSCRPITHNKRLAQLQHYRNPPVDDDAQENSESVKELKQLVDDSNIWRFKDELISKSQKVFRKLGFL